MVPIFLEICSGTHDGEIVASKTLNLSGVLLNFPRPQQVTVDMTDHWLTPPLLGKVGLIVDDFIPECTGGCY